jgi:hypothetical protein
VAGEMAAVPGFFTGFELVAGFLVWARADKQTEIINRTNDTLFTWIYYLL